MQTINEIKDAYKTNEITREVYRQRMFAKLETLFEYCPLLDGRAIRITEKGIVLCLNDGTKEAFKMGIRKDDVTQVPALILSHGAYEHDELEAVKKLWELSETEYFMDIGANVGWYSLNFLSLFGGGEKQSLCI